MYAQEIRDRVEADAKTMGSYPADGEYADQVGFYYGSTLAIVAWLMNAHPEIEATFRKATAGADAPHLEIVA